MRASYRSGHSGNQIRPISRVNSLLEAGLLTGCLFLSFSGIMHPWIKFPFSRILVSLIFGIVFFGIPIPVMSRLLRTGRSMGAALLIPLLWILLEMLGKKFDWPAHWTIPVRLIGSLGTAVTILWLKKSKTGGI